MCIRDRLTAMTKGDGDIDNATLREELEKEGLTVKTEGKNLPWDCLLYTSRCV